MFHYIQKVDRSLIWINNLFLLFVAMIPFPTALIGTYTENQVSSVMYGLVLICANVAGEGKPLLKDVNQFGLTLVEIFAQTRSEWR